MHLFYINEKIVIKYIIIIQYFSKICIIKEENGVNNREKVNLYDDNGESLIVKRIKEKLDLCNGKTSIKLFKGDICEISYDTNGKGLVSPKIPPKNQLIWEAFDAAVEIVINNGGRAEKGSARSKDARLGNEKLPLNQFFFVA